ncbi:protoporphyrinogen oxidase [Gordonia sp. ABSL1-1]|uniref:protoporphyrinogen oxidase n=1 Tax=Gordonia sp. ABSL1-1 TaxID=3053923 RepID=UPI0025735E86|nr:protoporphyrinogen oxidase [Gordonia sp. ABSL1-1]MDL9936405.1 protoporphyrinogen oxidase [Gordonia sp. ABSL1-1]
MTPSGAAPRVAVIGAGISGLTAAFRLRQQLGADARIDVLDAADRLGGILHTTAVGGQLVDVGAEAFIVRRPEALALVTELGLADQVVAPAGRRPAIWAGGTLHPLPTPALMGIPASAEAMSGLADDADLTRIAGEADRPLDWRPGADPALGDFVADRFGASVVARGVDPMLGGVYSSLSADIGLREAIPALAAALDAGATSLTAAVRSVIAAGAGSSGPVFGTLLGGYRTLITALRSAADVVPEVGTRVVAVAPQNRRGWTVVDEDGIARDYDGVVLATPAWTAGALLADAAPALAAPLSAVAGASSVVVSIALAPATMIPDHSGLLVATGEDLHAKAFTFSSRKWDHLADATRPVSVRASFGRFRAPVPDPSKEPGVDDRLRGEALADLDRVCAAAGVGPVSGRAVDLVVQRWPGGLPVYPPGHLARMRDVLRDCPVGLVLAGSAYTGVGVPACIGRAGQAVSELLAGLSAVPGNM